MDSLGTIAAFFAGRHFLRESKKRKKTSSELHAKADVLAAEIEVKQAEYSLEKLKLLDSSSPEGVAWHNFIDQAQETIKLVIQKISSEPNSLVRISFYSIHTKKSDLQNNGYIITFRLTLKLENKAWLNKQELRDKEIDDLQIKIERELPQGTADSVFNIESFKMTEDKTVTLESIYPEFDLELRIKHKED